MSKHSHSVKTSGDCAVLSIDRAAVDRVLGALPSDELIANAAALFAAVGDPTRLRVLQALSIEELCVCDLASLCGISQSGVSHQLRALRGLKLVAFRRDGNRAVYRLADDHVRTLLAQGLEHAAEGGGWT